MPGMLNDPVRVDGINIRIVIGVAQRTIRVFICFNIIKCRQLQNTGEQVIETGCCNIAARESTKATRVKSIIISYIKNEENVF